MDKHTIISRAVAINTEGEQAPDWVELLPAGDVVRGRDGRSWANPSPDQIIAVFADDPLDLPIDFEHSTMVKGAQGEAAPAVGWVKELDLRAGAVWGRVEWNAAGAEALTSKAYRYISPVFQVIEMAGRKFVGPLTSAGLTNKPNLNLQALNREEEPSPMDEVIAKALGLKTDASAADAVSAIDLLKSERTQAMNRAETPDTTMFVPRADYELAMNKVRGYEKSAADALDAEITSTVEAAIVAGKVAPASKAYHLAACKAEGGLTSFKAMVDAAPEIAANTQKPAKSAENTAALTTEQQAACRALGMSEADYAAQLEADAKETTA